MDIFIVYGDGLTQANMVRTEDKNNQAVLFFGISPLLLKNGKANDYTIEFQVYNFTSKSRYPDATYQISILKNDYSPDAIDKNVLEGVFLTKNGFLTLNIHNDKNSHEKKLNRGTNNLPVFHADNNDNVNLTIPFELQSGQYHIRTNISVPNIRPLLFNTIWQAGEIKSNALTVGNQESNITAISYYDSVSDFRYHRDNNSFTWNMPFEYNLSRIEDGKVEVHEELIIPNNFLKNLNSTHYNLTMNGRHFDEALFSIDPYTLKNNTIFHYVPKDNALFDIANSNVTLRANRLVQFSLSLK